MFLGRTIGLLAAAFAFALPAKATPTDEPDYVLVQRYEYSSSDLNEGSGKSSGSGGTVLSERIAARRDDGDEIEYSIPGDFDKVRGNALWMFPARVFVARDGAKTLLNAEELAARNKQWLENAEWPQEVCGEWIFTWTAIQILCDPQEVITQIEAYGMRPGIIETGASITIDDYGAELTLTPDGSDERGRIFTATAPIDSETVKRKTAQTSVIAAGFSGNQMTLEEALKQTASMTVEGQISVTVIADSAGLIVKRTDTYEMIIRGGKYGDERRTGTSTVHRVSYQDWLAG